jgi:hypothetical protein
VGWFQQLMNALLNYALKAAGILPGQLALWIINPPSTLHFGWNAKRSHLGIALLAGVNPSSGNFGKV